jgi:hypothetical protein
MVSQGFVFGQEKEPVAPIPLPSKAYSAKLPVIWEKVMETLKKNDIPIASSDQDGWKITTQTKRYFRILSANFPPIQKDYRDTYVLTFQKKEGNSTVLQINRKFEVHDKKSNQWVEGDPKVEKEGLSEEGIFQEVELLIAGVPS